MNRVTELIFHWIESPPEETFAQQQAPISLTRTIIIAHPSLSQSSSYPKYLSPESSCLKEAISTISSKCVAAVSVETLR